MCKRLRTYSSLPCRASATSAQHHDLSITGGDGRNVRTSARAKNGDWQKLRRTDCRPSGPANLDKALSLSWAPRCVTYPLTSRDFVLGSKLEGTQVSPSASTWRATICRTPIGSYPESQLTVCLAGLRPGRGVLGVLLPQCRNCGFSGVDS